MPRLRIVVLTADAERFRGALMVAAAHAAIGGGAAIFLQLDAVSLLRMPIGSAEDARHAEAGLPELAALVTDALDLGVALSACQSGLALAGLDASAIHPQAELTGAVHFLRGMTDADKLILV